MTQKITIWYTVYYNTEARTWYCMYYSTEATIQCVSRYRRHETIYDTEATIHVSRYKSNHMYYNMCQCWVMITLYTECTPTTSSLLLSITGKWSPLGSHNLKHLTFRPTDTIYVKTHSWQHRQIPLQLQEDDSKSFQGETHHMKRLRKQCYQIPSDQNKYCFKMYSSSTQFMSACPQQ